MLHPYMLYLVLTLNKTKDNDSSKLNLMLALVFTVWVVKQYFFSEENLEMMSPWRCSYVVVMLY